MEGPASLSVLPVWKDLATVAAGIEASRELRCCCKRCMPCQLLTRELGGEFCWSLDRVSLTWSCVKSAVRVLSVPGASSSPSSYVYGYNRARDDSSATCRNCSVSNSQEGTFSSSLELMNRCCKEHCGCHHGRRYQNRRRLDGMTESGIVPHS